MKNTTKRVLAFAGVLALGLGAVKAQTDGALLDALVKKGVLSDQEAEDIRASAAQEYSKTPAGKLGISDYVQKLTLYGDGRLRYEYIDETPQNVALRGGTGGTNISQGDNVLERYRYRLRIGADYTYSDNFKAGFELESNTASDSANQSLGDGFAKAGINIGLIYLQWKPVDWLTLTGGKQRNPLYTTDLTWDPDINPEGGSEVASWTFPLDFGSSAPAATDAKDMKAVVAPSDPSEYSLTVGFTAAQFIYADNQEYNTSATPITGTGTVTTPAGLSTTTIATTPDHTDVWQFVEQVPIQFNFDKSTFIKVAPGFDSYMSGGNGGIPSTFVNGSNGDDGFTGGGQLNFTGPTIADDLEIFQAPGEIDWKMWDQPFRAYWDFDLNTEGKARIQNVYFGANAAGGAGNAAIIAQNQSLGDNIAWLAGLQIGQNKKKGDWSIKGDFRQVGLGAIDPNENDSDWAESYLNQQGIKIQSVYNFTDFLSGSITYFDTWNYKNDLLDGTSPGQGSLKNNLPITGAATGTTGYSVGSPGTAGLGGLAGLNSSQRVDVDIMWKF
jgi:hypothetical protein